jgi:hypothetical protein
MTATIRHMARSLSFAALAAVGLPAAGEGLAGSPAAVRPEPTPEQLRACNEAVTTDGVVFPPDANVLNVKAFGAVGDGVHDDTEALQAAYNRTGLVYVPNGTYLVSRPIKAPPRPGSAPCRRILQGQSRDGAVIRLQEHAPGFGDPAAPQAVLTTAWGVAQAFRNAVSDVTFEVGPGNPGAIALAFFASNQGYVKNVRIRALDDTTGHTGLSLTGDNGPLLVWDVEVEGFETGVLGAANALATFEGLRVANQRKVGFDSGLKSYIHRFASVNKVPAVTTKNHMFILVDGALEGGGPETAALIIGSNALIRNVTSSGYARILEGPKGARVEGNAIGLWATQKPVLLNGASEDSVQLPVRTSPDVPWGDLAGWSNATTFPPENLRVLVRGKGWEQQDNWAPAIQAAIDSGAHTVHLPAGKWHASGTIHVRRNIRRIIGCEAELRPVDSMDGATFVIDEESPDPLAIERFDALYAKLKIENRSGRTLAVRHLVCDHIVKAKGAGDLFLDDVCCGILDINGGNVWARQLNQEGSCDPAADPPPRPNTINDGGSFWLFGLKTEQNRTKVWTKNGGTSEIYAYILANRASNPLPMFVAEDASVAVSVYETTLRNGPFATVLQTIRNGTPGASIPGMRPGSRGVSIPWAVAVPAQPAPLVREMNGEEYEANAKNPQSP